MAHGTTRHSAKNTASPPKVGAPTIDVPPRHGGLQGMLGVHPGLVLIVIVGLLYPKISSEYWTGNVTEGLVLAISALGLLVVVGWGREISLAQAGLTGSALYISGYASRGANPGEAGWDLPFPLAAAVGITFAVAVSALVALVAMRLSGVYVIVLTLSLQFLIENSLFTEEKLTGGLSSPSTPRPELLGTSLETVDKMYYFIFAFLLVSIIFLHRFRHSRFGRSMIMVGSDAAAAAAVGVSPWKYKVAAFAIAGGFAGLGGSLLAPLYGNPPGVLEYNSFNSLFYLSIPIMAGFESLMAVVAVALLFRLAPQIFIDLHINQFLLGGIGLALGVLVGPRGVGGAITDLFDTRARAKRRAARAGAAKRASPGPGASPPSVEHEDRVPATAGSEHK